MAIDWTKDVSTLTASDVEALTADERKILARLTLHAPIYGASPFDPTGVEMTLSGNGATQRARVAAGSVATALLRGWIKA